MLAILLNVILYLEDCSTWVHTKFPHLLRLNVIPLHRFTIIHFTTHPLMDKKGISHPLLLEPKAAMTRPAFRFPINPSGRVSVTNSGRWTFWTKGACVCNFDSFVKLPSVDIVPTDTLQPFMTKPHNDSLAGTWDLVCGQEGTGDVTADLGPFWAEVTVVWNKKWGPQVCLWEKQDRVFTLVSVRNVLECVVALPSSDTHIWAGRHLSFAGQVSSV